MKPKPRWGMLLMSSAVAACQDPQGSELAYREIMQPMTLSREPIVPLPEPPSFGVQAALGKRLFHDRRLSRDNTLACADCHRLSEGGDDGRARSVGVAGKLGQVNAPTVYNAALNFVQFWDGRAATLEQQVEAPIIHPDEMNSSWVQIIGKLKQDEQLVLDFGAAFRGGLTEANLRQAIATFERTLITRGSLFDDWLTGAETSLPTDVEAGYRLFKSLGCVACHQGANVGGNMYQRFGVFGDYFEDRGNLMPADFGRWNVTKNESDRYVFRVPSLRYVVHTAPYFHDGGTKELSGAVSAMARYQLGLELTDSQIVSLIAFLTSLAGPLPAE